jgi:hypothetical protein
VRTRDIIMGVVIIALSASVVYLGIQCERQTNQIDHMKASAVSAADSNTQKVRTAFEDGLSRCSAEDEATFHDLAQKMQSKMDSTTNPYKYLMYKYLYTFMYEWSDGWAYSTEEMQKMADEYMGGGVSYQ